MSKGISRRSFGVGLVAGTALATTAGCDEPTLVASISNLQEGVAVPFRYPPQHPAFIVKLGQPAEGGIGPDADIIAFHVACPHMGCPLPIADQSAVGQGRLGPCRCHQSTFDLRHLGRQIIGRASQNLVRVLLESDGTQIYAVGIAGTPFGEPLRT